MFHSARWQLTFWYVAMIFGLSLVVSGFIFVGVNRELTRIESIQARRRERQTFEPNPLVRSADSDQHLVPPPIEVDEIRMRLLLLIGVVNVGVIGTVGFASYFLAGKTLKPIEAMLAAQRRFVTDASHELKTPLTALRTNTEVNLRDKQLSLVQAKQTLEQSLVQMDQLQQLLDHLLQLSLLDSRTNRQALAFVSWQLVQDQAVAQVKALADQKKIQLTAHTLEAQIKGNQIQLTELLVILLDNAIKYSSPKTEVTVQSKVTKTHLICQVIDRGVGIAEADLPKIFERFYQADMSRTKTLASGYGLGLAIAQSIAQCHSGKLTVESKVGQGATFTLSLPR